MSQSRFAVADRSETALASCPRSWLHGAANQADKQATEDNA